MALLKVSIIIPVYKVERYLDECVLSVLKQNYGNLEVILVDDGSPDRCPIMCDEYAKKDTRIIVVHKPNGGLSDARNAGLHQATGDFVYFLDSDDVIYPDAIENMLKVVAKYPDVDMVYGGTTIQGQEERNEHYQLDLSKHTDYYGIPQEAKEALLFILPAIACNKLIRLSVILQNKLFFSVGLVHEDELWRWQICNHIRTCSICSEDTYWYRQENQDSIIRTKDSTRSLISKVKIIGMMLQTFDVRDKQDVRYIVRFSSPGFKYSAWDNCKDRAAVNAEIKKLQVLQKNIMMPPYLRLLIKLWCAPRWVYDNLIVSGLLYKYGVWWQSRYLENDR